MSNKYYTPEIEEFYVEFEFEFQGLDNYWNLTGWNKVKLNIDENKNFGLYTLKHIKSVLEDNSTDISNHIRAKYLDKQDIESLGFVFEGGKLIKNKKDHFIKENIALIYNYETKEMGIFTRDPSKNDIYSRLNFDPYLVNNIIVKNKTELKKLLKQLNIT
jgi:hypothetical protein